MAKYEKAFLEQTDKEYVVEIGTYLPIRKRLADLKAAGQDLLAMRQAQADFENGTRELKLEDYEDELQGIDEIDFFKKKQRYLEIIKQQEAAKAEADEAYRKQQLEAEINRRAEEVAKAKAALADAKKAAEA